MNKAIIIPVYLRFSKPEDVPYSEGVKLTRRAVESLNLLEDQDFTLILPVCFDSAKEEETSWEEMDSMLKEEFRQVREGNTFFFSSYRLKPLRRHLERKGLRKLSSLVDLKGFSKIRNTGLLLAQALSMDAAIFIDNDEVVEDPDYLRVACEYLNETWDGKTVLGKGGFYVNPDGTILLPSQPLWWRILWNKTKWMNQVWEAILSSRERMVPPSILLGGNLVLHRRLFQKVPFDPFIPRGEDTDYLINASHLGFCILFDKQLRVKHLHPERTGVYFHEELKGDIERFLYERQKVKTELSLNLAPYPGYFLKWTLYPRSLLTSFFLGLDYLSKRKWKRAKECLSNAGLLFRGTSGGWVDYMEFRGDWEKAMELIEQGGMDGILENCWC